MLPDPSGAPQSVPGTALLRALRVLDAVAQCLLRCAEDVAGQVVTR